MGAEADPQRAGDATGDDMEARLRGLDEHIDEAKGKQREASERADPDAVAGNFEAESEGAQQSRDASEFDDPEAEETEE
jgi:hypothetical protein